MSANPRNIHICKYDCTRHRSDVNLRRQNRLTNNYRQSVCVLCVCYDVKVVDRLGVFDVWRAVVLLHAIVVLLCFLVVIDMFWCLVSVWIHWFVKNDRMLYNRIDKGGLVLNWIRGDVVSTIKIEVYVYVFFVFWCLLGLQICLRLP